MLCPYILSKSDRVCLEMVEARISGEIPDDDYKRYCNGKPFHCYYFREAKKKTKALKKQK
jgi:hypothetical protein